MIGRALISAIGWASLLICWGLTGRRMTLCAYAYRRRHRSLFWRAWCVVFDWLLKWRHPCGHCEHEHRTYHGKSSAGLSAGGVDAATGSDG